MDPTFEFEAELYLWKPDASWVFATVPLDVDIRVLGAHAEAPALGETVFHVALDVEKATLVVLVAGAEGVHTGVVQARGIGIDQEPGQACFVDIDIQIAVDAIGSASRPHHFLSVTKTGHSAIFATAGNDDCHVILRGGTHTNYDYASVDDAARLLEKAGLPARLMIDCSHATYGDDSSSFPLALSVLTASTDDRQ